MNTYLLFKSLHLIAVISWMAGLLYLPRIFVYHSEADQDSQKTVNIPLVLDQKIPENLKFNNTSCIIGLVADPERLSDIRRNRVAIMKDQKLKEYTDLNVIKKEVEDSKKLFKKNNWPVIDVTRRSVEETAASILKIIDIKRNK